MRPAMVSGMVTRDTSVSYWQIFFPCHYQKPQKSLRKLTRLSFLSWRDDVLAVEGLFWTTECSREEIWFVPILIVARLKSRKRLEKYKFSYRNVLFVFFVWIPVLHTVFASLNATTAVIYKFTIFPISLFQSVFFFQMVVSIVAKKDLTYLSWHLLGRFTKIVPLLCQPVKLESRSYLLISKCFTAHPSTTLFHAYFIRDRGFLRIGGEKTPLALLMISESRVWFL